MIEIIPNWHPIFVHFTIALISVSAFCYCIGFLTKKYSLGQEFLIVARWCLWLGALAAIATVTAGFLAYYSVAHDAPSHEAMTIHRNWAITTFIIILLLASWSVWRYYKNREISFIFILSMVVAFLLVSITAWHGAELVYRYGLGVLSLPQAEEVGHEHQNHKENEKTPSNSPKIKKHLHNTNEKH